jgi:hypothetical protein
MSDGFDPINTGQVYLAKKTIRKVLRLANKFIRFSGSSAVEAELLIHFCALMRESGIRIDKYPVLQHLYDNQRGKAIKAIDSLHEDLQYELRRALDA